MPRGRTHPKGSRRHDQPIRSVRRSHRSHRSRTPRDKRIHYWQSDRYILRYYGKRKEFDVTRIDGGTQLVTVRPDLTAELCEKQPPDALEMVMLAAAGLRLSTPRLSAVPNATAEAPEAPATKRATAEPESKRPAASRVKVVNVPGPKKSQPATTTPAPTLPATTPAGSFTIDAKQLRAALAMIAPSIARKTALPILSSVLFKTQHGGTTVYATNLETSSAVHLDATTTDETPRIAVPYEALSRAIKGTDGPLTIATGEKFAVTITGDKTNTTLAGFDPEQFPAIDLVDPRTDDTTWDVNLPADQLRSLLDRAAIAAAKDDSRPVLAGISLWTDLDTLHAVSADGFRLTHVLTDAAGTLENIIVPARFAKAFSAMRAGNDVTVRLSENKTQLTVTCGHGHTSTRLIDGTFPDWKQIMPRDFASSYSVLRTALIPAVEAAAAIAKSNNDVSRWTVDPEAKTLTVSAKSADVGESSQAVNISINHGTPPLIAFNAKLVLDALKTCTDDVIQITMNGANQAGVFSSYRHDTIVMPMTVKD